MCDKSKQESDGLGTVGALVLGGVAGAVGFIAAKLWSEYNNRSEGGCGSRSRRPPSPPPRPRPDSWDTNPRARMESRKTMGDTSAVPEVPAGQKCLICFDNQREVLLEPCNHVCVCEDCAERLGDKCTCPVCRERVTKKRAIYL